MSSLRGGRPRHGLKVITTKSKKKKAVGMEQQDRWMRQADYECFTDPYRGMKEFLEGVPEDDTNGDGDTPTVNPSPWRQECTPVPDANNEAGMDEDDDDDTVDMDEETALVESAAWRPLEGPSGRWYRLAFCS